MHYDALIIGAGMSGLAAGIRLAYFGKSVLIVERHYAYGGLNSYYKLHGREFDVGLHALTNYVPAPSAEAPPGIRNAPLNKLLRQLRLNRDELDLCPQTYSEIRFPERTLRFTNDIAVLTEEVAREFPLAVDAFRRFLAEMREFDDVKLEQPYQSARAVLRASLPDPLLIEMLLCPVMYYGSAEEGDMDFTQFVTMFKSLFFEGFARPRAGVRAIVKALVRQYRACGGKLKMQCGVERILHDGQRVTGTALENGEIVTADVVLSSAGYVETMRLRDGVLCAVGPAFQPVKTTGWKQAPPEAGPTAPCGRQLMEPGRVSFVESIATMDKLPQHLGHRSTIIFFNDAETFTYEQPHDPIDFRSGVICCPSNYQRHDDMDEGIFRVTWLANCDQWLTFDEAAYQAEKVRAHDRFIAFGERYMPGFANHVTSSDLFTPRTIQRYTGHINGAVYGAPHKVRDGRTDLENLFIIGTDQGFLGIVGAMLSGITIANLHVLSQQ